MRALLAALLLVLAAADTAFGGMAARLVERLRAVDDGIRIDVPNVAAELGFQTAPMSLPRPERARLAFDIGGLEAVAFAGDRAGGRFGGVAGGSLRRAPYIDLAGRGDGVFLRHDLGRVAVAASALDGAHGRLAAAEAAARLGGVNLILQGGSLSEKKDALDDRLGGPARTVFAGAMARLSLADRIRLSVGWHEGRTRGRAASLATRAAGATASLRRLLSANDKLTLSLEQGLARAGLLEPRLSWTYGVGLPLGQLNAAARHRADDDTGFHVSYSLTW